MEYKVKDFTSIIEQIAPLATQESYDNSGLIVGNHNTIVTGVLLSFDCIEETVEEAISLGANLIIAHHPIVFKGLKKFNGSNYVERTVIKAIKHDIAIYAAHTNLDNSKFGVNYENAKRLGIKSPRILSPLKDNLRKLVFFCPENAVEKVKTAIFNSGGGNIGNYEECSFETSGIGQFTPNENANPSEGTIGKNEKVQEKRVEVLIPTHFENQIVSAMKSAHPYEEVAYEVYPIANKNQDVGAGMIGDLDEPIDTIEFLKQIKQNFNCGVIKHTALVKDKIQKVAFCGGSGSFLLSDAKRQKADVFITGDFKYHEFFDAENDIIIADIGHFESEQYTPHLIFGILKKNFTTFAIHLSKVNTNPINYF